MARKFSMSAVVIGLSALALVAFVFQTKPQSKKATMQDTSLVKVVKTDDEWQKILSPEEFRVARKKGTERSFTGRYWDNKKEGVYNCVCCGLPLFESKTKFESGTGWPSFYAPINPKHVKLEKDNSLYMERTEVVCARCDGHLGHVFDDAPQTPTGQRYCLNSVSLKFAEK
jgi:peptide-methionine (R)-S-oxide reductase